MTGGIAFSSWIVLLLPLVAVALSLAHLHDRRFPGEGGDKE
ncbi:hypothetical protein FHS78_000039 [Parvibaculum indicum]|nr:hypothetical protein [Parvibaculum indicum]NIJ39784.1 hypothetical protein [Parvibaculum indicum]